MKTKLKEKLEEMGLKPRDVALNGISRSNLTQHLSGLRAVGPKMAIRYEEVLGIPRWELRPDLWEKPKNEEQ